MGFCQKCEAEDMCSVLDELTMLWSSSRSRNYQFERNNSSGVNAMIPWLEAEAGVCVECRSSEIERYSISSSQLTKSEFGSIQCWVNWFWISAICSVFAIFTLSSPHWCETSMREIRELLDQITYSLNMLPSSTSNQQKNSLSQERTIWCHHFYSIPM